MKKMMIDRDAPEERSLYEASWDWLGEIILSHEIEGAASGDPELEKEANEYFSTADERYLDAVRRCFRKARRREIFLHTIPGALRILITIIGILALAAGIAYASSPQVRTYVARLIITAYPEYTVVRIENETGAPNVPGEWGGSHYPSVMPEGLVLGEVCSDVNEHYVDYRNAESDEIVFSYEEIINGSIGIDTQDAAYQDVTIHGYDGHAVLKNDHVTVYWQEGNRLLIVYVRGSTLEFALDCADGVRPIE